MNNYPDILISAMKGLLNNHTNNEIITELFKDNSNSNSELKNKLNLLEKHFNREFIADYLFNYDKYQKAIIKNKRENSSYHKNEINNNENKINFNLKNNISNDSDDFSSIFKLEKNEDNIGKNEDNIGKK